MRDYAEVRKMCDRFQVYLTVHRYDIHPPDYAQALALCKALRWVVEPEACPDEKLTAYIDEEAGFVGTPQIALPDVSLTAARDCRERGPCQRYGIDPCDCYH